MSYRRILVVGTTGSGKTSFARELSARTGIPHVEIDALYHQPGWIPAPSERIIAQLHAIAAGEHWIVDGNYTMFTRETLWPRAEMVVWLDDPLWTVMRRVCGRTLRRLLTREELWNGNRETLRGLCASDNVILWALRTHAKNRLKFPELQHAFPQAVFMRLRNPRNARRVLEEIAERN